MKTMMEQVRIGLREQKEISWLKKSPRKLRKATPECS